MTACALISPEEFRCPVIVGDTVVTVEGKPSQEIRPTTILFGQHRQAGELYLARKTFIITPEAAIAVSGNEDVIRDFLEYAKLTIMAAAAGERPMRAIGDRAEAYGNEIHVVGSYVRGNDSNLVWPEEMGVQNVGALGRCMAIGSGADTILSRLKEHDRLAPPGGSPFSRVNAAAFYLQHGRLLEEIFMKGWDPSWGGYIERVFYDPRTQSWRRQERTLHLFFQSIFEGEGLPTPQLIDRVIAYDPGADFGRILSILGRAPRPSSTDYGLLNLLKPADFDYHYAPGFWKDWKPERVMMACVALSGAKRPHYVAMGHYDVGPDDPTLFSFDGRELRHRLNDLEVRSFLDRSVASFLAVERED